VVFLTGVLSGRTLLSDMNNTTPADNVVLREAIAELQRCLPGHWTTSISVKTNDVAAARLTIKTPAGASAALAIGNKRQLDPKFASAFAETLKSTPADGFVVVAPFLGERTRDRLSAAGVGYVDLAGNMRVSLDRPTVFIQTRGAHKSPWSEPRVLRALDGRKACCVVRALCDDRPPFGVRALAARAGTDPGYVSRLLDLLDREELIERIVRGAVTAVDVPALIRRWAVDYRFEGASRRLAFSHPHGMPGALGRLRDETIPHALTARAGAAALLGTAFPGQAALYVDNPDRVARRLGLTPATYDAGLILIEPFDPVVFTGGSARDGLTFAAPSQIAADLLGSGTSGTGMAEAVMRKMWPGAALAKPAGER
jgi:hypothetical protein